MTLRLRNLTLTALSTALLCAAPSAAQAATIAVVDSGSTPAASGTGLRALPPQAHASVAKRSARRSQGDACGAVNVLAGDSPEASQARTTVCLLNRERTSRGLRPLALNGKLSAAASSHNRDMVSAGYFAHESRSGSSSADRVKRTGYLSGARSWIVGENLAWGSGSLSTPREIVSAWMHSPGHRANILTGRYREIGVGIDFRAPMSVSGPAVTYTTEFGARS